MQLFYGWIVVAVCFVILGIDRGINNTFSLFYVVFLEEFGWSRAMAAGAYSFGRMISGLGSVGAGILNDRLGARVTIPLGALILGGGLFLASQIDSLGMLYLSNGVIIALGLSLAGEVPATALLSQWFIRKRGTAMGLATAGMGLGVLILLPLTERFISFYGWREAYFLLGILVILVLVPMGALFLRQHPEDMGLLPDALSSTPPSNPVSVSFRWKREVAPPLSSDPKTWTMRAMVKTLPFWCIFLSRCISPIGMSAVIPHQVAYLVDTGFSKFVAAFAFGLSGILSSVGRIVFGILSDRIGREKAVSLSFLFSIVGIILLLQIRNASQFWLLYLQIFFFGIGQGSRMPLLSSLTADLFQGAHYGFLLGLMALGQGIGGTIGPWMSGYLFDHTGSYTLSFSIAIMALACSCGCVWLAKWTHEKSTQKQ